MLKEHTHTQRAGPSNNLSKIRYNFIALNSGHNLFLGRTLKKIYYIYLLTFSSVSAPSTFSLSSPKLATFRPVLGGTPIDYKTALVGYFCYNIIHWNTLQFTFLHKYY